MMGWVGPRFQQPVVQQQQQQQRWQSETLHGASPLHAGRQAAPAGGSTTDIYSLSYA